MDLAGLQLIHACSMQGGMSACLAATQVCTGVWQAKG